MGCHDDHAYSDRQTAQPKSTNNLPIDLPSLVVYG